MQTTNIPIYRAKKIDGDEWVEGYYIPDTEGFHVLVVLCIEKTVGFKRTYKETYKIDINTLAIHFPNMIDKNGKKIFASLSEDGVGGDIVHDVEDDIKTFMIFKDSFFILFETYSVSFTDMRATLEVIGIHKGE